MDLKFHPRQAAVMKSQANEILFGGAAGGGKSFLFRAAAITWSNDIPGLQTYIFRRTSPQIEDEHMTGAKSLPNLLSPWVQSKKVKINYNDNEIHFRNGSTIHLCHCQYPKDVHGYDSAEMHVLMLGEAGGWTKPMYTYLRSRVRMVNINLPERYKQGGQILPTLPPNERDLFPRVLLGANPGGIGHNWLRSGYVVNGAGKIRQMADTEGGMYRQYIPSRISDNPDILRDDPKYISRLAGVGRPDLVKALLEGDWDIVAGGAVDDVWNLDKHVLAPFDIPSSWYIDRAFDWGSTRPFSVGWYAESDGTTAKMRDGKSRNFPRGTIFRIGEWYGWNGADEDVGLKLSDKLIGQGIREREEALKKFLHLVKPIAPGPADSMIFDDLPGRASIAALINEGYWGSPTRSSTDIFTKADKSPGSRKRRLSILRAALSNAAAVPMEGPGFFVFDTCTDGFIRTVPPIPRSERDPDDIDTAAEDHVADEVGYRLTALRRHAGAISLGAA